MFYRLKENGEIRDCSTTRYASDCLETEEEIGRDYRGVLRFAHQMQGEEYEAGRAAFEKHRELVGLRVRRKQECFSVVNRGAMWYNTLSQSQKEELQAWYQAWLDAPASGVVPEKPQWLS